MQNQLLEKNVAKLKAKKKRKMNRSRTPGSKDRQSDAAAKY